MFNSVVHEGFVELITIQMAFNHVPSQSLVERPCVIAVDIFWYSISVAESNQGLYKGSGAHVLNDFHVYAPYGEASEYQEIHLLCFPILVHPKMSRVVNSRVFIWDCMSWGISVSHSILSFHNVLRISFDLIVTGA